MKAGRCIVASSSTVNPDAYQAFDDPRYAATYVNVLKSFADLAAKREWKRSGMQVYFNNKGSLNDPAKAPWILDEPSSYWGLSRVAVLRATDRSGDTGISQFICNQYSVSNRYLAS